MKKMQYSERKFIIRGISLPNRKISTHKREAEKGSGDWSPGRVWGGNPIVTPFPKSRSDKKNKNQGAKRNLIPLTTHRTADPVTPALGRAPQGG